MKSTSKILIMLLLFSICLSVGCAGIPLKVGNIEPQFDYNSIDWNKGRSLESSASGFQLLVFFPIAVNNRQERAYQGILDQVGNDFITDVKIKESWTYAYVGIVHTTTIEAMAYPRKTEVEKSNSSESAEKLRELKKLKDEGFLTDKEHEIKRKAIVDGI